MRGSVKEPDTPGYENSPGQRRATSPPPHTCYFLDDHLAEVAGDVRQQVPPRVADLVHQLLGHRAEGDQASGSGRFGEDEGAVARTLDHREANVVPGRQRQDPQFLLRSDIWSVKSDVPIRNGVPVGEDPARALSAALDQVTCQTETHGRQGQDRVCVYVCMCMRVCV